MRRTPSSPRTTATSLPATTPTLPPTHSSPLPRSVCFSARACGCDPAQVCSRVVVALLQIVTALTVAGRIDFNPITDTLIGADGKAFKLSDPSAAELPVRGFDAGENTYQVPSCQSMNFVKHKSYPVPALAQPLWHRFKQTTCVRLHRLLLPAVLHSPSRSTPRALVFSCSTPSPSGTARTSWTPPSSSRYG